MTRRRLRSVGIGRVPLLVLVGLLAVLPGGTARAQEPDPLVPRRDLSGLHTLAWDLSKLGSADGVDCLTDILVRLGETEKVLDQKKRKWAKNLERASGRSPKRVAAKLLKQAEKLGKRLAELESPRAEQLAEIILELDSSHRGANEALGRVERLGEWLLPVDLENERRRERVAELTRQAQRLPVEVECEASASPVLRSVYGEEGIEARANGIRLIAHMDAGVLSRVVRQVVRALALSSALRGGELEPPKLKRPCVVVLMDNEARFDEAVREALAGKGITQELHDDLFKERSRSYTDGRGWRTSRWRAEADYESLLLWLTVVDQLGEDAQACLVAGHINWLALNFFGTSIPSVNWTEVAAASRGTVAGGAVLNPQVLRRSAQYSSLFGCRSWLVHEVRRGNNPTWSNSMREFLGQVSGENLLKTTLVNEYLQEQQQLTAVLEATRGRTDRIAAFEAALGVDIPTFDERWAAWLIPADARTVGLLQRLGGGAVEDAPDGSADVVLPVLNGIRARALSGQFAEFEKLIADPELAAGSLLHAHYLALNEDQQTLWPEAHEEFADREGFTAAGSRAGLRGVIAFTDDPVDAIHQWMATFYHRLPLLEPGLFGVGYGGAQGVAVLEVGSLVTLPWREHWVCWPHDGMTDVPRRWMPELPNPVPGEDQTGWGYPVTLQVSIPDQKGDLELELRLHRGDRDGPVVDCHFLSPQAPKFAELVPKNAWCLIPRRVLGPGAEYVIVMEHESPPLTKSWRFTTR